MFPFLSAFFRYLQVRVCLYYDFRLICGMFLPYTYTIIINSLQFLLIACWPKFKFALILIVILFIQLQMDFDQTQAIYDYEEEEEERVKQDKTHAKKKEVNLKNTPFIIQDRMMHE